MTSVISESSGILTKQKLISINCGNCENVFLIWKCRACKIVFFQLLLPKYPNHLLGKMYEMEKVGLNKA